MSNKGPRLRGAVGRLLLSLQRQQPIQKEQLFEGPRGTGKTHGILWCLRWLCETQQGVRVKMARKYRATLAETVLPEWEESVLGLDHPAIGGVSRSGRSKPYRFPATGSEVILGGFDDPEKVKSSQVDFLYVNEATELTEEEWEAALATVRNYAYPTNLLIADCNPEFPTHWLNRRPEKIAVDEHGNEIVGPDGQPVRQMARNITSHKDNPRYWDSQKQDWTDVGRDYMRVLRSYGEGTVRYNQWFLGIWSAQEGAVYGEFWKPKVHIIDSLPHERIRGYFGSIDWGWNDPQVVLVWAWDNDKRIYCVEQHYKTETGLSEWKRTIQQLQGKYNMSRWVADPSEKSIIQDYRSMGLSIDPAENDIIAGIRSVQERLRIQGDGKPRLFVLRDSLAHEDKRLKEANLPTCGQQEFEMYSYEKDREGNYKEKPADKHNHFMDAMRYAVRYADRYLSSNGKRYAITVPNL